MRRHRLADGKQQAQAGAPSRFALDDDVPLKALTQHLNINSLQAGIDLENRTQIMTTFTQDHREQITAFLGKRPPHYTNE